MSKNTIEELSDNAYMNIDVVLEIILKFKEQKLPKNKVLQLNEIIPQEGWYELNQGQKGYVGKVFYDLHKDLGFEYAGKGICNTTNLYPWVKDADDL
jgi:hypothetical protein